MVTLTPFEKASALSYFLTDGPPDAELLAAARAGALETTAQLEAHTRRLLAKPEMAPGLDPLRRRALSGTREVLERQQGRDGVPRLEGAAGRRPGRPRPTPSSAR